MGGWLHRMAHVSLKRLIANSHKIMIFPGKVVLQLPLCYNSSMNSSNFWLVQALTVLGALLLLQWLINAFLRRAAKKNFQGWKAKIGKIFRLPITLLIWSLGSLYLADLLGLSFLNPYLDPLRKTAIVGTVTWLFYRWKDAVESAYLAQPSKKVDSATIQMVGKLTTVAVGVLAGLIILQVFGVNIAPLLAFGSIGAASIGFAGKDVMANFCSGIMLHVTRPFVIGEHIFLPEKDLEGQIEEIGWFRTSIRDKDKRPVYLPNNYFSTMLLVNISRMTHRRFKQLIKIGFDDVKKVGQIVDQMRTCLENTPEIDTNCPLHVYLKNYGDYACEIEVEAYCTLKNLEEFNRFQNRLLLTLQSILQEMDVKLAIPASYWKT